MKKKFLSMLLAITATISLSVNSFAGVSDTSADYNFFDTIGAGSTTVTRWNFIKIIYEELGFGLLGIVQHIGIWGTILATLILITGLIVWQGNMKERTKVIKSIGVLIVAFVLLISIISWVSLFQNITTLSSPFLQTTQSTTPYSTPWG